MQSPSHLATSLGGLPSVSLRQSAALAVRATMCLAWAEGIPAFVLNSFHAAKATTRATMQLLMLVATSSLFALVVISSALVHISLDLVRNLSRLLADMTRSSTRTASLSVQW